MMGRPHLGLRGRIGAGCSVLRISVWQNSTTAHTVGASANQWGVLRRVHVLLENEEPIEFYLAVKTRRKINACRTMH